MAGIDLDLRKLKGDVAKRQAARPVGIAPGGRRATGSMAIVRQHLAEFDALRAKGATWAEIASGLAEQGVTQGENQEPITAKRLTSLVSFVRKAEAKRVAAIAARKDLAGTGGAQKVAAPKAGSRLSLSPELASPTPAKGDEVSEDEIRREAFAKHSRFFGKDPK